MESLRIRRGDGSQVHVGALNCCRFILSGLLIRNESADIYIYIYIHYIHRGFWIHGIGRMPISTYVLGLGSSGFLHTCPWWQCSNEVCVSHRSSRCSRVYMVGFCRRCLGPNTVLLLCLSSIPLQ